MLSATFLALVGGQVKLSPPRVPQIEHRLSKVAAHTVRFAPDAGKQLVIHFFVFICFPAALQGMEHGHALTTRAMKQS